MPILEVNHINKSFGSTKVLDDISLSLERGQALAIIGSSGSGKTTLLRCLNFLETPNAGQIVVNGETLFDAADHSAKSDAEIRKRRLHFGMVFQSFNLFPQYTALENVMLASLLLAKERPDYKQRKHEIHEEIEHHAIELLSQMVSAVCGTGKHQHLLPVPFTNHVRQQFAFAFLIDKVNVLGHLIRRGIAACHFDFQRVVQQFFRQGFNIVREGRREQQVLAFRWQFC